MISVFRPGSRVAFLGEGSGVTAVVLAAEIRGDQASRYEVAWWVNGDRKTAWVEATEVGPAPGGGDPLRPIGFRG